MLDKKGFTMVELIGVIVILSAISVITFPVIIGSIQSTDEKEVKAFLKSIYLAAETYVEANIDMFNLEEDGSKDYVLISELIGDAYLNGKMVNPNTKEAINKESSIIEVSRNLEGVMEYNYVYVGIGSLIAIENIEDLVTLAKEVNSGEDKKGIIYHLSRDLDFLDTTSYANADDKSYGDINENGVVETIKEELTTEKGFKPIGFYNSEFQGSFYGRNKIIKNLYINRPNDDDVGLFGSIRSGFVNSLVIEAGNVTGKSRVGLAIGSMFLGTIIEDVQTSGYSKNSGDSLGGIIGMVNSSNIFDCDSSANVMGSSTTESGFGGLVGSLRQGSEIKKSSFTGTVESNSLNTGGIVGYSDVSVVEDTVFAGNVVGNNAAQDNVGGIVGSAASNTYLIDNVSSGTVIGNSYNTGGIVGKLDSSNVNGSTFSGDLTSNNAAKTGTGGIAGWALNGSQIKDCLVEGSITAETSNVGGISGATDNSIIDLTNFTGEVMGVRNTSTGVGGISGYTLNGSEISNSNSSGSVISKSGNVGGITGSLNASTIADATFNGALSSDSMTETGYGGISGYTYAGSSILNSVSLGSISAGRYNAGGITGSINNSSIDNCFSASSINGWDSVGGITGYALNNAALKNNYSTGNVEGINYVGGIIGLSKSITLNNAYSIGSTKGNSYVGGITGTVAGTTTINNAYTTSDIFLEYKYGSGAVGYIELDYTGSHSNVYYYDNQVYQDYKGNPVTPDITIGTTVSYNSLITTAWQQSVLGNHFAYVNGNYPQLYKNDGNGNPTGSLIENQQDITVE